MYTEWKLLRYTADVSSAEADPTGVANPSSSQIFGIPLLRDGVARISAAYAMFVFTDANGVRVAPSSGTASVTLYEVLNDGLPTKVVSTGISHVIKAGEVPFNLTIPGNGRYVLRVTAFATPPGGSTKMAILIKMT